MRHDHSIFKVKGVGQRREEEEDASKVIRESDAISSSVTHLRAFLVPLANHALHHTQAVATWGGRLAIYTYRERF